MFSSRDQVKYSLVVEGGHGETEKTTRRPTSRVLVNATKTLLMALFIVTTITALIYAVRQRVLSVPQGRCERPSIRREWQTLSTAQKLEYINSIKCLQHRPSKLEAGGSQYDEFLYIHRAVGHISHEQPSFLSWHRYFIHIFESRLRSQCHYHGPMPRLLGLGP